MPGRHVVNDEYAAQGIEIRVDGVFADGHSLVLQKVLGYHANSRLRSLKAGIRAHERPRPFGIARNAVETRYVGLGDAIDIVERLPDGRFAVLGDGLWPATPAKGEGDFLQSKRTGVFSRHLSARNQLGNRNGAGRLSGLP